MALLSCTRASPPAGLGHISTDSTRWALFSPPASGCCGEWLRQGTHGPFVTEARARRRARFRDFASEMHPIARNSLCNYLIYRSDTHTGFDLLSPHHSINLPFILTQMLFPFISVVICEICGRCCRDSELLPIHYVCDAERCVASQGGATTQNRRFASIDKSLIKCWKFDILHTTCPIGLRDWS